MSSAAIQRNIETRLSNVHIHSIEITYVVRRHIVCTVRLQPISLYNMVRQCALFGEEKSNLIRSSSETETYPIIPGLSETLRSVYNLHGWISIQTALSFVANEIDLYNTKS
jgi:hypothetical protein